MCAWPVLGKSVTEHNTVSNLANCSKHRSAQGITVVISPHYYYPSGHTRKNMLLGGLIATAAAGLPAAVAAQTTQGQAPLSNASKGTTHPLTAQLEDAKIPAIKPGTNTSFSQLKQINAGVLNVGYEEAGPANGSVVVLLHGWPYVDISRG